MLILNSTGFNATLHSGNEAPYLEMSVDQTKLFAFVGFSIGGAVLEIDPSTGAISTMHLVDTSFYV